MLQQEFEARVKIHVSCKEYEAINEVYNNSDLTRTSSVWSGLV